MYPKILAFCVGADEFGSSVLATLQPFQTILKLIVFHLLFLTYENGEARNKHC